MANKQFNSQKRHGIGNNMKQYEIHRNDSCKSFNTDFNI